MPDTPLGPITSVRCTVTGCPWAVHGIPDQYDDARAEAVARHLAEEHAEPAVGTPSPLSDEQLTEIRNSVPLGYAAPWAFDLDDDERNWVVLYDTDSPSAGLIATVPDYGMYLAEFIATARTAVPALLAEVDRLRAERDQARAELATARAQALTDAAEHLDRIADEAEAQVAAHYGKQSGIGPGSADILRECARTLRDLAARAAADAPH